LPTRATESFTVVGPDLRPVEIIDEYLGWLTNNERSPNTVEAYAHDLRAFWTFLDEHALSWEHVGVMELAEFAAWARRPAKNVVVIADEAARLSSRTVNRMLTGVVGFYELQARRGHTLAKDLVVATRSGRGGYKPFLHGIARGRPRGRAVRCPSRRCFEDADVGAGRCGRRCSDAVARPVLVRVAGEHGDADRSGTGVAP
jgi:hypothetical protein